MTSRPWTRAVVPVVPGGPLRADSAAVVEGAGRGRPELEEVLK